jgi:hypothetical protein
MSSNSSRLVHPVCAVLLFAGVAAVGTACESSSTTGTSFEFDGGSPSSLPDGASPPFDAGVGTIPVDAGGPVTTADAGNTSDGSAPVVGSVAIDIPALGSGFDYHQASYSLGWSFVANAPIRITALGFYDDLENGLTQSHPVAIYDKTTQTMLASTTVTPSDPLDGFFRYAALDTPLTLTQGTTYVVLTWVGDENYIAINAIDPGWTVNSVITYTDDAVNYATPSATGLVYPDTFVSGGDFGPNFKFANP